MLKNIKKKVSKKAFSAAKTPLGELIIGIAFAKFSNFLPVEKIKETDKVVAFWHPKPFWQKHILLVPKKPIKSLHHLSEDDSEYLSEIYKVADDIVGKQGWKKEGYTLLVNGGGRQEIPQLHFHLCAGTEL